MQTCLKGRKRKFRKYVSDSHSTKMQEDERKKNNLAMNSFHTIAAAALDKMEPPVHVFPTFASLCGQMNAT